MTKADPTQEPWEVIVVGGGLAGLSAALYLGRSKRRTLVIESGHSMAVWEPRVENYLGFPDGVSGEDLLQRGRKQAARHEVQFIRDEIVAAQRDGESFLLQGRHGRYAGRRLLLATGITHKPPEIPEVRACLGRSLFFCKDCDGYRVQGGRIGIIGRNNETVDYALAMLVLAHRHHCHKWPENGVGPVPSGPESGVPHSRLRGTDRRGRTRQRHDPLNPSPGWLAGRD